MKKLFRIGMSIFLAGCMTCMPVGQNMPSWPESHAKAATENEFEGFSYSLTGFNATITGYTGDAEELVIPQKIQDKYKVVKINDEIFSGNSNITSVDIPEGVTTIGVKAFYGCENLKEVHIPSTITSWRADPYDNSAFENCSKLETLTLADGLSTLGQRAFAGCTSLKSVCVPSGITSMGNRVFAGCTGLTDLTLSEGIEHMGYQAFEGCTALKEVTIPSTIRSWGLINSSGVMATTHENRAFCNCTSLEKITFTEGLTTLENFQGLANCPLVKEIEIPSSVTKTDYAFCGSTGLEKVVIREGLEEIGTYAFQDCSALKEIQFPSSVTKIGYGAFDQCRSLQSIYLFSEDLDNHTNLVYNENAKVYCLPDAPIYHTMETLHADLLNTFPPLEGIQAEGYSAAYDGEEHDAVILNGLQENDAVTYQLNGGKWQTELPRIKMPGTCTLNLRVLRTNEGDTPHALYCQNNITVSVTKKMPSIQLKDVTVNESENYEIAAENFDGDGDIVYNYYDDEALTIPHTGKPTTPGTYYVQAVSTETEYYSAAMSNVAKIIISGQNPETTPTATPGTESTTKPTTIPTSLPSTPPQTEPTTVPNTPPAAPSTVPANTSAPDDVIQNVTVGKVTLRKVKATGKKTMQIQWKKSSEASGYEIWIGQNKKFTKGKKTYLVKSNKTTKKKITKLKSKTTFYVKIRAYRTVNGKKQYGTFSSVKSVRIK